MLTNAFYYILTTYYRDIESTYTENRHIDFFNT